MVYPTETLTNLDLHILSLFWKGLLCVMFSSSPQTSASQKAFFICLQRNHTSALLWNESSYQPCLTGKLSSPQHRALHGLCHCSGGRQTYVASKIQDGSAFLFSKRPLSPLCMATPRCCLRKGCPPGPS